MNLNTHAKRGVRLLATVLLLASATWAMVLDWNGRPLSEGTAVVYDGRGAVVGLSYITSGRLLYPLPWGPGYTLRVAWGFASLYEVLGGNVVWIYDSAVTRDTIELGLPQWGIRTWVYPVTVAVRDGEGRPVAGCVAKVVDAATGGRWLYVFSPTDSDGSVSISQAPATDYYVYVYCDGALAAEGKFSIQRGAPSTAWNVEMKVQFIDTVKVANAP